MTNHKFQIARPVVVGHVVWVPILVEPALAELFLRLGFVTNHFLNNEQYRLNRLHANR